MIQNNDIELIVNNTQSELIHFENISSEKELETKEWIFDSQKENCLFVIPIKQLNNYYLMIVSNNFVYTSSRKKEKSVYCIVIISSKDQRVKLNVEQIKNTLSNCFSDEKW